MFACIVCIYLNIQILRVQNSQSARDASDNPSPGNSCDSDRSVDVCLPGLVGVLERTGPQPPGQHMTGQAGRIPSR